MTNSSPWYRPIEIDDFPSYKPAFAHLQMIFPAINHQLFLGFSMAMLVITDGNHPRYPRDTAIVSELVELMVSMDFTAST